MTEAIGDRGQMDLIDMTSCSDGIHNWILRFSDCLCAFQQVRALTDKSATTTATGLLQILSAAPHYKIIQSDNGGEFLGETVAMLNR